MNKKNDIDNFLKKELKALADKKGYSVVAEQKDLDDKKAKKIKVKAKKIKVKAKKIKV